MNRTPGTAPAGPPAADGVSHERSPYPVGETVTRLSEAIAAAGAKVFTVVDHSGEARQAGLSLRDTKLLIFGSPVAGTPVMAASPLAAIDLPLKVLVWQDDDGTVWMSYLDPAWLASRHKIADGLAAPLGAAGGLTRRVASGPPS